MVCDMNMGTATGLVRAYKGPKRPLCFTSYCDQQGYDVVEPANEYQELNSYGIDLSKRKGPKSRKERATPFFLFR